MIPISLCLTLCTLFSLYAFPPLLSPYSHSNSLTLHFSSLLLSLFLPSLHIFSSPLIPSTFPFLITPSSSSIIVLHHLFPPLFYVSPSTLASPLPLHPSSNSTNTWPRILLPLLYHSFPKHIPLPLPRTSRLRLWACPTWPGSSTSLWAAWAWPCWWPWSSSATSHGPKPSAWRWTLAPPTAPAPPPAPRI